MVAFGVNRNELRKWKIKVQNGEIAFLTHYWLDERFPNCQTVTKVGCADIEKLMKWGSKYSLQPRWIDRRPRYPHFDLFNNIQREILIQEELWDHIRRFRL